jgi:hypothetical protein
MFSAGSEAHHDADRHVPTLIRVAHSPDGLNTWHVCLAAIVGSTGKENLAGIIDGSSDYVQLRFIYSSLLVGWPQRDGDVFILPDRGFSRSAHSIPPGTGMACLSRSPHDG